MAWTQQQLDDLRSAYAQGALSVRWGDRSVQFATREDLAQRIREMEQELGLRPKGMQVRQVVVNQGL
jgi:hypothetical protein